MTHMLYCLRHAVQAPPSKAHYMGQARSGCDPGAAAGIKLELNEHLVAPVVVVAYNRVHYLARSLMHILRWVPLLLVNPRGTASEHFGRISCASMRVKGGLQLASYSAAAEHHTNHNYSAAQPRCSSCTHHTRDRACLCLGAVGVECQVIQYY